MRTQTVQVIGSLERDGAIVELYDVTDDRQAETVPFRSLIQPRTAFGEMLDVVVFQSFATVFDAYTDALAPVNFEDHPGRRPFERVVKEIAQQFEHVLAVTKGFNTLINLVVKRNRLSAVNLLKNGDQVRKFRAPDLLLARFTVAA